MCHDPGPGLFQLACHRHGIVVIEALPLAAKFQAERDRQTQRVRASQAGVSPATGQSASAHQAAVTTSRKRSAPTALARARAGALARDTAMLRAALTIAEREKDLDAVRTIVALALGVVGDGPARSALLAVQARAEKEDRS